MKFNKINNNYKRKNKNKNKNKDNLMNKMNRKYKFQMNKTLIYNNK